MIVSRQSDSIWVAGAMGYGRQHSPARDEDRYGLGSSAREHGESMGRKHAGESIREYHRDERGRFAPMPHHERERDEAAGRTKREHRDTFHESYHKGFHSKVKEHEAQEKEKANRTSMVHSAGISSSDIPHEQWRQLPRHHQDAIFCTENKDHMAPELAAAGHEMDWQHGDGWAQKGRAQYWNGNCRNCGANVTVGPHSTSSISLGRDARKGPCSGPGTKWQNDMLIERRRSLVDKAVGEYLQQLQGIRDREKEADSDWLRGIGIEGSYRTPTLVVEAAHLDPSGRLVIDDPGRFNYMLEHGGSDEGYEPPGWLNSMVAESPQREQWRARNPTEKNPHRYDTDTLKNIANDPTFGLSLGMSDRAPFSREDVGFTGGDRRRSKTRAALRPGEIASQPIQVQDYRGNVHTFVHHVTAPNLNLIDEGRPEHGGPWVVSLHHHVSRPNGTSEWLPSEVSHHSAAQVGRGQASNDLLKDIWGQLHANSDMVTMYGAGAQRVGDKNNSIEYEFRHPQGDVVYHAKLANGWNRHDGYYYDPSLPERHEDRASVGGKPQWIVTGRSKQVEYPYDADGPSRMTLVEGSEAPSDRTVSFDKEDLPGLIQHVWNGLGANPDAPAYRRWREHRMPNTQGRPPGRMIRNYSIKPWRPEHNVHRSAERLPTL